MPVQPQHLVSMLIENILKIKEFIPVNNSLEFQKLNPFVAEAEDIVADLIGRTFYDELDEHQKTPAEPNLYFDAVIKKLQDSISFLTFDLGFDVLNTVFSNTGFHRVETEDGSKKPLFQRQEENLRNTFKFRGYNKLDKALEYLELNKEQFATWTASEEYTLLKRNFINSTKEFSNIYNINNSRIVFLKLRNAQVLVEDFDIKPLIGFEFYDELKTQVVGGTLTDVNRAFVAELQKAVAYRAIYHGGFSLIAELNEMGFYQKELDINVNNVRKETAVSESLANGILAKAEQTGKAYLKSCESFLKKNIADYPLYAASTAYDQTGSVYQLNSTSKIGVI